MKHLIETMPPGLLGAVIAAVLLLAIYAVRKGYLKVHVKGFDLERPSVGNEPAKAMQPMTKNREMLLRMVNFTEDLMDWGQQEVTNRIRNQYGGEVNFLVVRLVCEKIFDRCLTWIILNHIEDTKEYFETKSAECFRAVITTLGGYVPDRVRTNEYQSLMRGISEEFVREFIKGICAIKAKEKKNELPK